VKDTTWMNVSLPIEQRALELLKEMTLEEKVGQLNQRLMGFRIYEKKDNQIILNQEFKDEVEKYSGIGALYGLFRADPWSGRNYENGITRELVCNTYNRIQKYVIEHSRLRIPVLMSSESPHGHQALDGYLLPVNLAAGATFHPEVWEEACRICGQQMKEAGIHLALVSMLDVLRDPRWGRSEECFSEDPILCGIMAHAAVSGINSAGIMTVAKHMAAQGECTGGVNGSAARIGEHELREIHYPVIQEAIKSGVAGLMAAYNEIDGVYCHANKALLTELLRKENNFSGIVMADGKAIDQLDRMTADNVVSAALALNSGVDMGLWDEGFGKLTEAFKRKLITEDVINQAVLRVLTLKFESGVFEHPYLDEETEPKKYLYTEYPQSLNVARESIILLENKNKILPLSQEISGKIAVIGPNANEIYNQLGDYTPEVRAEVCRTVYQGICEIFPHSEIMMAQGCFLREKGTKNMQAEALACAEIANVTVLVVGSSSNRFGEVKFQENGAAVVTDRISMDCGEGMDCADLHLPEVQMELFYQLRQKAKKLITIVISGRPLILEEICKVSDAVLLGFYPGPMGGTAVAEILSGKINPSGRLPVSLPEINGQLPVYYNQKASYRAMEYVDCKRKTLFEFGYGLDYSEYIYREEKLSVDIITLQQLKREGIKVTFEVENTGAMKGFCVPQIYIRDLQASITRRTRELKGLKKVELDVGEKKELEIELDWDKFALYDVNMNYVVEPGEFKVVLMDKGVVIWERKLQVV
jgi:beta-glucosidase